MFNNPYMFNPYGQPNINVNNMMPQQPTNFDFNGRWVETIEEARNVASNNLPVVMFDKNKPLFYMKGVDGTFKTYEFKEVIEQKETDRIDALEDKINAILGMLAQQPINNTSVQETTPQTANINGKEVVNNG